MSTPAHLSNTAPTGADQHKQDVSVPSQPRLERVPHSAASPSGRTYLGKSLLINGEVSGSEPLHIEGRVEGSIALPGGQVSIGRDGVVAASV